MKLAPILLLLLAGCANQIVHDPLDRNLAQNKAAQAGCQQVAAQHTATWIAQCFNGADEIYFTRVQFPWMDLVHDLEVARLVAARDLDARTISSEQGRAAWDAALSRFSVAWRSRLATAQQRQNYDDTVALAILSHAMTPPAPPPPIQVQIVPQNLACGPLGCLPY